MSLEDFINIQKKEEREKNLILGKSDLLDEFRLDKNKNWELLRESENHNFLKNYNESAAWLEDKDKAGRYRFKEKRRLSKTLKKRAKSERRN